MASTLTLPDWTSDPPTEPGVYRYRGKWGIIHWASVESQIGGLLFARTFGDHRGTWIKHLEGQWQGPIVVEE